MLPSVNQVVGSYRVGLTRASSFFGNVSSSTYCDSSPCDDYKRLPDIVQIMAEVQCARAYALGWCSKMHEQCGPTYLDKGGSTGGVSWSVQHGIDHVMHNLDSSGVATHDRQIAGTGQIQRHTCTHTWNLLWSLRRSKCP